MPGVHRTESGSQIVAGTRAESHQAVRASRAALHTAHHIRACGHVVKRVLAGLGQAVQRRIDVALSGGRRFLVQQRHDPGKYRARHRSPAINVQITASVDFITIVIGRSRQCHVGEIAGIVARHAQTRLPERLREEGAGAAAGCRQTVAFHRIVPRHFRYPRQRRRAIGGVGQAPVCSGAFVELGPANGRHFGQVGGKRNGGSLGCLRGRRADIAGSGAPIA